MLSRHLFIRRVGRRYLRLDRRVEGLARLSPSILREFLTYSVVGSVLNRPAVYRRAGEIESRIGAVSRSKADLAHTVCASLASMLSIEIPLYERGCFILAGDIVFNMAHDVPRPERSTGKLVRGSDMDLVVIVGDRFPKELVKRLDDAIFEEKVRLLRTPHIREEIDYVVKDLDRVREQVRFDTFRHMVACKILQEGALLCGSEEIFHEVKTMLRRQGVLEKLDELETRAKEHRREAERYLLREDVDKIREHNLNLFYPSDESEEFE
jgi:hypothetical protein